MSRPRSRRAATRGSRASTRPQRREVAGAQRVDELRATRAFSRHDVARDRVVGDLRRASRRAVSARRVAPAAASHAARRSAYALCCERARQPAVHDDDARPIAGARPARPSSVRQSSSSAWPARPNTDAIWSMTPHGTPDRERARPPARRARASPRVERQAARRRRSDARERDLERRARRESRTDRHRRRDRGVEADGRARRARGEQRRDDRVDPTARRARSCGARERRREVERTHADVPVGAGAERDEHLAVDRDRQAEAVLVVGVVADQVDAPGARTNVTPPPSRRRSRSVRASIKVATVPRRSL